ncbi:muconolactone Delta-isomerase [Actinacidiphila epipremni]|jgi:muconolactone D-isomerase|uniref:Muconolactone delta-isomerase n=1 Tax=Actinacidiphila epipremni TaxID=2053013 RepID=A0ABX0ZYG6_9ACTN|nr:muconolactone Delta-isomerase family protein [Actinacidiphila epipremni]NJP47942.1 muconolactone delta-isomerase [Actinacidiphila epipremni]
MEWLVRTHNRLPADTPAAERERLRAAERGRAMELRAEGVLRKLWRTPGSTGTVALYECRDATHLHDVLSSLPVFPWLEVSVEPLATHPQEAHAAALAAAHGSHDHSEGYDDQPV